MRTKKIENFKLHIGDLALDKVTRKGKPYILAVSLEDPSLKLTVTYDDLQLVDTNMDTSQINYVISEIRNNREFL